jgi:hypothetical protein
VDEVNVITRLIGSTFGDMSAPYMVHYAPLDQFSVSFILKLDISSRLSCSIAKAAKVTGSLKA